MSRPRRHKQKFKSDLAADKALRRISMELIEQLNLSDTTVQLYKIEGLTQWEMQELSNPHNIELERKTYLITTVLPNKGHYKGMRLLRRALKESKQDELLNILEKAYEGAVDEVIVERLNLSQAAEVRHEMGANHPVQPAVSEWHDSIVNSAVFSGLDVVHRGSEIRNSRNLHESKRLSSSSSSSINSDDENATNDTISLDSPAVEQQHDQQQQRWQQQQPLPPSYVNVVLSHSGTATISVTPSSHHQHLACDHISHKSNVAQPEKEGVFVTVSTRSENSNYHNDSDIHNAKNSNNHHINHDEVNGTDILTKSVNELPYDSPIMKFVFVGDAGTGKTSLLERYINNKFSIIFEPTIIDFKAKELTCYDTKYKLYLWDTAGQEKFKTLTKIFYRDAVGAFVVYDVTRRMSLEHCLQWKTEIDHAVQLLNGDPIPIVLIANKIDCCQSEGNQLDGEKFSKENRFAGYFETSAKTGAGIKEAIHFMTKKIHKLSREEQEPVVRTLSRSRAMSIKLKDYGDDDNSRRKCCKQ